MDFRTVPGVRTSQDNAGIVAAINDTVAGAGTHKALLIEENAG